MQYKFVVAQLFDIGHFNVSIPEAHILSQINFSSGFSLVETLIKSNSSTKKKKLKVIMY